MNRVWIRLALALATIFCISTAASASDCIYGTGASNKGQCYPTFVPTDPATGLPAFGGGGGSGNYTGATATSAGTNGSTATPVQGINGGVPVAVTWTGQSLSISNTVAVNNTQINGATIATGSGASNAGTMRMIIATDNPTIPVSGSVAITNPYQTTTGNALEPATAASGKIIKNEVAIAANTSTQIAPSNASRIAVGIQCPTGGVQIDETGAALSSATTGGTLVIPAGTQPYFSPPIATRTAITAYTATAQSCKVTEYNR